MVFGYLRVSSDKQDVESQKIGVDKKAAELGYAIDDYIKDEGVSGVKDYNKRNLGKLLKDTKSGDIIIVSEISRLARSVFMLFRIVEHCVDNDIIIYSVKDSINTIKKGDLTGIMMVFCFGIAAQIEREMIVKRTVEGLERRRRDGVVFGRPVGSKSKNTKLSGKNDLIKQYNEAGLNSSQIARIMKVNRETLYVFCRDNKIDLVSDPVPPGLIDKQGQNKFIRLSKERAAFFQSEKDFISELIHQGLTPKYIIKRLLEKTGLEKISEYSFREWLKRENLYDLLIEKTAEQRAIRNKDCGSQKQHYKF
jgi:DNA invertase Pin-like site-specific DNA recombinase